MAKRIAHQPQRPSPVRRHSAEPTPISAPTSVGQTQPSLYERASLQMLAATYWFEPEDRAEPYPVTIRFSGRRISGPDIPPEMAHLGDIFTDDETIPSVVPGSGPISVTARVRGLKPGEWQVTAGILEAGAPPRRGRGQASQQRVQTTPFPGTRLVLPGLWQRWAPPVNAAPHDDHEHGHEHSSGHIETQYELLLRNPGALPFSWLSLVVVGMIVALLVQAQLIARAHLPVGTVALATVLAMAAGAVGAKIWHLVKHPHEQTASGWCIQGFILGATLVAGIAFLVARLPLGTVLDASAPGLLFGMAIGRVGCFLAGCCGGPPTSARWGIWSSDQRIGARRVPTQLMESLFCLLAGLVALLIFLGRGPAGGALFVTTLAAYTLFREGILRLREERTVMRLPVPVTPIVSALVFVIAVVFLVRL